MSHDKKKTPQENVESPSPPFSSPLSSRRPSGRGRIKGKGRDLLEETRGEASGIDPGLSEGKLVRGTILLNPRGFLKFVTYPWGIGRSPTRHLPW
jgi:hypothetical protein|uniref:Uncharacterized protein n=1 Tax=Leptospirillum ferrodiazotrophum TaxID=412449 RepID=C6HTR9_9BACT|nr:MAG: hypothetical protein UBAL3_24060050 [Leptospirillum ferrodiazotrophum]